MNFPCISHAGINNPKKGTMPNREGNSWQAAFRGSQQLTLRDMFLLTTIVALACGLAVMELTLLIGFLWAVFSIAVVRQL